MKKKHLLVIALLFLIPLASWAQESVTITVAVNDSAMGTINPAPGTYTFAEGDEYSITATSSDGYRLMGWVITMERDGEGLYFPLDTAVTTLTTSANPVDSSRVYTVVAVFETTDIYPDSMTMVIEVNNPQMGTVTPGPGVYHFGLYETVFFEAEAYEGYEFIGWHTTISHPSQGVTQYEDMLLPYNTVGPMDISADLLGYVNRLIALFAPEEVVGVENVNSVNFKAYGREGRIFLNGAEGREVYLFDINGRLLHHSHAASTTESYPVPAAGVYLIRVQGLGSKSVLVTR